MTLDIVAFDIETTGFTVEDEVTVAGFALEMGARVFYQTGGRPAEPIEQAVREKATHNVQVSAHESEAQVLDAMAAFVAGRLAEQEILLVAYNGETWRGGVSLSVRRARHSPPRGALPLAHVTPRAVPPSLTRHMHPTP